MNWIERGRRPAPHIELDSTEKGSFHTAALDSSNPMEVLKAGNITDARVRRRTVNCAVKPIRGVNRSIHSRTAASGVGRKTANITAAPRNPGIVAQMTGA